jgi:hypothetical protein
LAAERWKERQPAKAPPAPQEVLDFLLASRQAAIRRQRLWLGFNGTLRVFDPSETVVGERNTFGAAAGDTLFVGLCRTEHCSDETITRRLVQTSSAPEAW